VFNIYVNSEEALTAGREIYGYPKKMCDIKLSPIQDNKIRGTLTRKGITFLDIEVELKNKPPSKPALRQLTETILSWDIHKQIGGDTKYLKTKYSKFDICHEVLKDAIFNRGAIYVECDQTLPNGRPL